MWIQVVIAKPTVISTFAGCGGSSLGYQLAGFHELLAVEWDNNAVQTFKMNFPDVPVYHGDIAKLTGRECMDMAGINAGELDVLDGSPPCQGFSTAGKRKFDDPRNSLFKDYARLIQELQPKAFVMENVTGMIKGYMKQAYLEIIKTLRGCGYKANGEVMNAMYYNVPQSRERVIIIGIREDLRIEPSHPKPQTKPITVREAFNGLHESEQDEKSGHCWVPAKPGSKTFKALVNTSQGETLQGFSMSKRLKYDSVSGTIQTGGVAPGYPGSSWPSHPVQHRGISMREAARLASFPDSFSFNDWKDGCKRIGNSVPPNLMRAIAEHVKQLLVSAND